MSIFDRKSQGGGELLLGRGWESNSGFPIARQSLSAISWLFLFVIALN